MAKIRTLFCCNQCDYSCPKWMGKCPQCGNWNSLQEEVQTRSTKKTLGQSGAPRPIPFDDIADLPGGEIRFKTGINELDTVLGGGLVGGSLVLVGGDPGVGKSTLLLMALSEFARKGHKVLYVSGEESARQIHLRGKRLGVSGRDLLLLAHTDFSHIEQMAKETKPLVIVIDSIQTVHLPHIESIPGSITQIREVAHRAMLFAKNTNTAIFLIGHVTKSGQLAGPKVLEHFVDCVLYFEGDGRSSLRILRAVKNRFGPAGELGLFEMVDEGLKEVPDASARLLEERVANAPGTAVISALEGSRPLLTEVQALVGRASPATPSRTCVGVDRTRVIMLAAVLEKCGISIHDRDLFVNAAGGVRVLEPATDLGIICAIASSLLDQAIPEHTLLFGEVGLVGEVRAVSHPLSRLKEAARHGFRRCICPKACTKESIPGMEIIGVRSVREALSYLF